MKIIKRRAKLIYRRGTFPAMETGSFEVRIGYWAASKERMLPRWRMLETRVIGKPT